MSIPSQCPARPHVCETIVFADTSVNIRQFGFTRPTCVRTEQVSMYVRMFDSYPI